MSIKLYNTMGRKVEDFTPLTPNEMNFYSCGPTVYHFAHIGNLRTYVGNDILKRMFLASGYKVNHIMNITDVGHLTSDSDEGQDKMEKGAARTGKSVWEVAKFYTDAFMKDIADLNILPPTEYTKATDYIDQQKAMVEQLADKGYTYALEGDGIYYDTSKFPAYGELGGQNLAELLDGARIGVNEGKKNATDFAVWKFSPKDEQRQMEWDNPCGIAGKGFPGWHLECSVMAINKLGERLDIHTGGVDHIKVHHTNEIAQSEACLGHKWVNYWVHFEHLNDKSGKMSKSNGEFLTLSRLKELGFKPMHYRYFLLLASYRTQLAFSEESLKAAASAYDNLVRKVSLSPREGGAKSQEYKQRILSALQNDLNTAEALAVLQESTKTDALYDVAEYADSLLGLTLITDAKSLTDEVAPKDVIDLATARTAAKSDKDFAKADSLRAQISDKGWIVEDTKDGFKLIKK